MTELSIIIPVVNEEKNIPILIDKYKKISKKEDIEVIFVEDGGSNDNTRDVLRKFSNKYEFVKYVFPKKRGYGASIYAGLVHAKGKFMCWTHGDVQTDPNDTLKALNIIEKQEKDENFFIKGKRYGRPLFDVFFTICMSFFESLFLLKPLWDINAQPNLFRREFLKFMKNPPEDFSFDLYAYYSAKKNGYRITRFPVHFGKRIHGESKWNTGIKSKMKFIKRTLSYSLKLKKQLRT